jgi:transcriptional regulator with XRE-family HTH domain
MKSSKCATEVDTLAGQRLRAFRVAKGLSQTAVAEHLGVTFQQVQKYERGANRMGASRLAAVADLLRVPVADFFEDNKIKSDAEFLIKTSQERRLLVAFRRLTPTQRASVADLVERMR